MTITGIEQLKQEISNYNEQYRLGKPVISDAEYDALLEELSILSPNDNLLTKVGHVVDESRKYKLPIEMASMGKMKSIDDVYNWSRLKGIPKSSLMIISPKFDGLSLCVDEESNDAITRGDGVYGQKSNEHYSLIGNHYYGVELKDQFDPLSPLLFKYTYGEVMMPKQVFIDKYSMDFANPRNLVAGLLNSPDARQSLKDCKYIKYGAIPNNISKFTTKQEILDELNNGQKIKVQYHVCKFSELTEDLLIGLFHKFSTEFEIDGVIIEVNDLSLQDKLGRETSSKNPCYAKAFKHISFDPSSESEIVHIIWEISKNGLLKPVAQVNPINIGGVTITNCTLNNAKFVKDNDLGVGSRVLITRSGGVIPKIVKVIKSTGFEMPDIGVDIGWNDNDVELVTLDITDDQEIKKIIAFFEILECDNVGEGVIKQLWDAGHKTIKDIISLRISDLEKIDRFGKRKSTIVYNSIQGSVKDVSLSKLQHATGIFVGLGSKKLILLEHFKTKPTLDQVMVIDGFAETSSQSYINGYDKFKEFIKDLPITFEEKVEISEYSNDLEGMVFVFTGIRLKEIEPVIESRGGRIGSSISKNTTHLVCKDPNSVSSKMQKAKDLGVMVLSVEDLEELLN